MGGQIGSTYESDVWNSTNGATWNPVTSSAQFGGRSNFSLTVYNGYMWVIGGMNSTSSALDDVWNSNNGTTWNLVTSTPGFAGRSYAPLVVFNPGTGPEMCLIGGAEIGLPGNDIWTSTTGSSWTQVTTVNPIFSGRYSDQVVACGNALWTIGGLQYNGHGVSPTYDVWVTQDLAHWTETNTANPFDMSTGTAVS
jgi:hypothetical protein